MTTPITRNQLNNCYRQSTYTQDHLQSIFKNNEYKQQIKKYVDEVINVITNDLISNLNPHPNAPKKYVYTIGNFGSYILLKHPQLPYQVVRNLKCVYKNEIEKIYPISELMDGLREKFPDSKIILNYEKTTITIDWSI